MGLKIKMTVLLLTSFFFCETGFASWSGPTEVLSGTWGSSSKQFAIEYGDSGDSFPRTFCISSGGSIAIADEFNSRVQTYKTDGSYIASFGPQNIPESEGWKHGWPLRLGCLSNSVYTEFDKYTQIYGITGSLIRNWDALQGGLVGILSNDDFITETSTAYFFYSPTGQIIKTSAARPLELGVPKEVVLDAGKYKTTVTYDDHVYVLIGDKQYENFVRDNNKNIYGILPGLVDKYTRCGKRLGRLIMPDKAVFRETPPPADRAQYIMIHDEYGSPVIDVHGNVYTWKRTPSKYSILKWTWKDDPKVPTGPDAPTGLSVAASINGLYLTWATSPNDPGCVTGYEIVRATSAGGVFSTVATVEKGVVKYNDTSTTAGTRYCYKVRAKAGKEFSPYTSRVSGKR